MTPLVASELYLRGYNAGADGEHPRRALWDWPSYREGFEHGRIDAALLTNAERRPDKPMADGKRQVLLFV